MSAPVAVDYRRCPDHPDAELVPIPNCSAVGIACTGKVKIEDTEFTCGARICGRCSDKGADWMSGLCSACYRIVEREKAEQKRIDDAHYSRASVMRNLIDEAEGVVKAWLVERNASFDAEWNAVIEERYS